MICPIAISLALILVIFCMPTRLAQATALLLIPKWSRDSRNIVKDLVLLPNFTMKMELV
jgi:hypothetical protein